MTYLSGEVWIRGGRKDNQDSIVVQEIMTRKGKVLLAAVCDGMGGHAEGETASGFVAEQIVAWLYAEILGMLQRNASHRQWKRSWYRCFYHINQKLNTYAEKKEIFMGTTMTMLFVSQEWYHLCHIGDSRAYKIRNTICQSGYIKQMTKDHIDKPHVLTRCIGTNRNAMPDYIRWRMRKNEGILLCSDGFYRCVHKKELAGALMPKHLKTEKDIRKVLREVAGRVQERGETDNISAVYVLRK